MILDEANEMREIENTLIHDDDLFEERKALQ